MSAIKAVFWDIDGVIVNSEPLHEAKIIETAKTHGVIVPDTTWVSWQGIGDHNIYKELIRMGMDIPEDQFLKECEDYYLANAHTLTIRDGFREAFNMAAEKGLHQAAVSSGVKNQVEKNLEVAGVREHMMFAINATDIVDMGLKTKPEPDAYNHALERLNEIRRGAGLAPLKPEECLVIEDSPSGVRSGYRAGMVTLHWRLAANDNPCPQATFTAHDKATLLPVMRNILG